jgi:hypothetical protein
VAGNFSDWAPYYNYVQNGMVDGNFVSGAFTIIAAGPPRLANVGGAAALADMLTSGNQGGKGANQIVFPMGIVQNFSLSQTRAFQRVWEVGSERSYFIAGRNMGQIGLGRIYYHGPSMLRVLYAYYQDLMPPVVVKSLWPNKGAEAMSNPHDVYIPPGYENIYLNLASDLFAQPVGMLLLLRDVNLNTLGAIYFEACYVPNHTWGVDSQGVIIQEQAGIQYERALPVQVASLSVITSSNAGGANLNTWL